MFKVFAFLKRNDALLSHDEYRAGHVGYHCGQSRRLKDIRGYLVNIWSNTPFVERVGQDVHARLTLNEPADFLNWWDGFPEVYFDNQESWVNALTVEPNRAMADGLVIDPDWSLDDGPFLFAPVPDRPGEFKPCHILVHEHVVVPVERAEHKVFKLVSFFRRKAGENRELQDELILAEYGDQLRRMRHLRGCLLNFRDDDQDAAMRGFYPDNSWGHSGEGVKHRADFCAMWDGAVEYHFDDVSDFLTARAELEDKLKPLEAQLFDSLWYVEIDENLVVLPNRDPAPDFYYR